MEQKSILEGITEHDVVTVQNPLNTLFEATVARSVLSTRPRYAAQPTGNGQADAFIQNIQGGIPAGGHQSWAHVPQSIPFKPGQSLRLPGDVARVVVRQIIKEMMQRVEVEKDGRIEYILHKDLCKTAKDRKECGHQRAVRTGADLETVMEYERRVVVNHASMLSNMSVETTEERLQRQLDELNPVAQVTDEVEDERPFPTEAGSSEPAKRGRKPATAA